MSKKAQDNIFCLVLLIVLAAYVVLTLQLVSFRARLVPLPIAAISILLLLVQLYFQNFRPDLKLNVDSVDLFKIAGDVVEEEEEMEDYDRQRRANRHSVLGAFGIVFGLFAGVMLLGILQAAFLFIIGYFVFFGKEKLHVALAWSTIATGLAYVLFFRLVYIQPWMGYIWNYFFPS